MGRLCHSRVADKSAHWDFHNQEFHCCPTCATAMRMHFDTIVFDLDGTLVDTAGDLAASLNHALWTLGRPPVPPSSVRSMVGHGARKLLELGLAATGGMTAALVEAGVAPFMDYYSANIAIHSRPFPGVEAALDRLAARGHVLAICTNKPERLAANLVAELGWTHRFKALLGADSRPYRKPDPRHLLDTVSEAGGTCSLFVGDSRTDTDTAAAAGVPLVLVSFGYSTEPVAGRGADVVIDHFDDLDQAMQHIQGAFSAVCLAGKA